MFSSVHTETPDYSQIQHPVGLSKNLAAVYYLILVDATRAIIVLVYVTHIPVSEDNIKRSLYCEA